MASWSFSSDRQVAASPTTLRMLAGLDDVTSGKILIGGKDVAFPPG